MIIFILSNMICLYLIFFVSFLVSGFKIFRSIVLGISDMFEMNGDIFKIFW